MTALGAGDLSCEAFNISHLLMSISKNDSFQKPLKNAPDFPQ